MTTKEDIKVWLQQGVDKNCSHVIIFCDTFDHGDYPTYVKKGEDPKEIIRARDGKDMTRFMECYDLSMDIEAQLNENRAYHMDTHNLPFPVCSNPPIIREFRYETTTQDIQSILATSDTPSVFIAGPTVRGNQPHLTSWRFKAVDEFKKQGFHGNLIIPEFTSRTESDKHRRELPIWEFTGLKLADVIMFWIPRTRELIGLTTNHELGYWVGRHREKVVYGRPDDAYRIDYLDIMWEADAKDRFKEQLPIYNTLETTITKSIEIANQTYQSRINRERL
jgi:hypothetical protein